VTRRPDRFDRLVLVLPAGLDRRFRYQDRMLRTAELIEGRSKEEAIEAILADPDRVRNYLQYPFLRDMDRALMADLNPVGVPRAIREIIGDTPLRDREDLRAVTAPTLVIAREGDDIHPAEVARVIVGTMPNAELIMFPDGRSMYEGIPMILERVRTFLTA
jgi:pimeloyl-ACP methyl ester carboxylesterase